jgi:hypothetical protein
MGELKDWGMKNSKFLRFSDGDSYEGIFQGHKLIVKDSFGEEKEVVRYKIDGRTFDSQSISLADQMDSIQIGDKIRLTRFGAGTDTKWSVEKI